MATKSKLEKKSQTTDYTYLESKHPNYITLEWEFGFMQKSSLV